MSSVASEIWLLPLRTWARTASIRAQILETVRPGNLPTARTTHNHPEIGAVRVVFECLKQLSRVVRSNRLCASAGMPKLFG